MDTNQIPIRTIRERKSHISQIPSKSGVVTYEMASKNLNENTVKQFIEGSYFCKSFDDKFRQSLTLLESLAKKTGDTYGLEQPLMESVSYVTDLETAKRLLNGSTLNDSIIRDIESRINVCEACDRVIRNNEKLSKRFNFSKVIQDNKYQTPRHTIHELCALIDTYEMSNRVKLNVALENINYSLYSNGVHIPVNEVTDYIMEYFLNRESIITDKDSYGYLKILENNVFVDQTESDTYNLLNEQYNNGLFGNYWHNVVVELSCQCESGIAASHISAAMNVTNEKQASDYIKNTFDMIDNGEVSNSDADKLIKSIYTIPLMGNVSKTFIDYKVSQNIPSQNIKDGYDKIADQEKLLRTFKNDDNLTATAEAVSENVHLSNDILDENYQPKNLSLSLYEGSYMENEDLKKTLNAFKASQDKSPSKFKYLMKKIVTKSPEDIIGEMPGIFSIVRGLIYIAIAASNPVGPIVAIVTMLITEITAIKLNMKKARSLMHHLQDEKKKVEAKRDKAKSDKERNSLNEYINCLDQAIKQTAKYITDIDEDDDEASSAQYGGSDDFDLGDFGDDNDFDFDFEESTLVVGKLLNMITETCESNLPSIPRDIENEALLKTAELFDNCPESISDEFYKLIQKRREEFKSDPSVVTTCTCILDNKGKNRIKTDPVTEAYIQCDTYKEACTIMNEGFDLNTLKLAVVNMKKKAKDLSGKEKEISRNIDIATSGLMRGMQQALTSNRREAIIKGSIIPSFSKLMKSALVVGGVAFVSPVTAAITAVGMLGASKYLNHRERMLIYDEIDTELQVVDKQLQMAENDGDMNQYRFLLNYQKKLLREKQRIKYGIKMQGRNIPEVKGGRD